MSANGREVEFNSPIQQIERWGLFEVCLHGPITGNPYTDVQISARFRYKNRIVAVDGFYDGKGIYIIRFMPDTLGEWSFETKSSSSELDLHRGTFVCVPALEGNHGPVRVSQTFHFAYEDGSPYLPFGTTCYHWIHHGDEAQEQETLMALTNSPFNKLRMCLLPTQDQYPPLVAFAGSRDEGMDLHRFNPDFFAHLEKRIVDLMQLGIEADLILYHPYDKRGVWGFDRMDAQGDVFYLRYVIARLAAYRNVWWSISNEYDFNKNKTMDDWDQLLQVVQQYDPYRHLSSIHNGTHMYEEAGLYDFSKPWVTHQSIQHWDLTLTSAWREQHRKPVVIDECCYEGNGTRRWGNISGEVMMHRFWEGMTRGGYVGHGETYVEYACWISRGGTLYGESPARIAFLRGIMEEAPRDLPAAHQEGTYYLRYFGIHQPAYCELDLPERNVYQIEIIDAWEMTITPVVGSFKGKCRVELPGKPYTALRIRKIS